MTEPEVPAEAEPADVLEQRMTVEVDEEAERRPVTPPTGPALADDPEDA